MRVTSLTLERIYVSPLFFFYGLLDAYRQIIFLSFSVRQLRHAFRNNWTHYNRTEISKLSRMSLTKAIASSTDPCTIRH